jgi:Fic family protein
MGKYIYQDKSWPDFTWNNDLIIPIISDVRFLQGKLSGNLDALGFTFRDGVTVSALTEEIVKSSEVEGEILNPDKVRSSIARRLGINTEGLPLSDHVTDSIVEMMVDAVINFENPITDERLFSWHSAIFPTGRSGLYKIHVGEYRTDVMEIVSGAFGKEFVHYEAPSPEFVREEMAEFISWFNSKEKIDSIVKAALTHLRFVTIHPFDDGNGRITRALTEMQLARSEINGRRYYSMSAQIMDDKTTYYDILEETQHGDCDVTKWIIWFLTCLQAAIEKSISSVQKAVKRNEFWEYYKDTDFNSRQRKMIEKFIEGFEGSLRTSKWARITNCSQDTALRDINDLIEKGVLNKNNDGGRSTSYTLIYPLES